MTSIYSTMIKVEHWSIYRYITLIQTPKYIGNMEPVYVTKYIARTCTYCGKATPMFNVIHPRCYKLGLELILITCYSILNYYISTNFKLLPLGLLGICIRLVLFRYWRSIRHSSKYRCSTDKRPFFLMKRFMGTLLLIPLYLFIMDSLNSVSVGMVSDDL